MGSNSESEIKLPGMVDKDLDDIISIHNTNSYGSDINIKLTSLLVDLQLYEDSGVTSKDRSKGKDKSTGLILPIQKSGRFRQIYCLCAILSVPH